ncbi:ankyrin repeat [Fusarium mundagurra]|uniref:Ankyrin repeat n=1 Tax=Fusarium mundagurra TaxID=1567541 RepID=A0A8H5Z554_9HYPO|nr:ankyrin repeat [Fusarium mundagurra]
MSQQRRFGLNQVWPDPTDRKATEEKEVDIIFMHGLDAQSPRTWIAWVRDNEPESGEVFWLKDKDMLPRDMPYARILTYDWNANYDKTASSARFLGHADTLLDRIYIERDNLSRLHIPIIFVASCFSGLLLAESLIRATECFHPSSRRYRKVLDFTVGVAFLGTPFKGSWNTGYSVADMRVSVAIQAGLEYNRELMEYLRLGTPEAPGPLESLTQRFSEMIHHQSFKFGKSCFYETRHTNLSAYRSRLPKSYANSLDDEGHGIVVAEFSACLEGVERVPLDVRHNMLHKFNSPKNDGYQRLVSRLKLFYQEAQFVIGNNGYDPNPTPESIPAKEKKDSEWETKCLEALYFDGLDYEPEPTPKPAETAGKWLIKHRTYSRWHKDCRGIFWILGNPGSGKSVLIKRALRSDQGSAFTLSFFFRNQGNPLQRTGEGLIRALLYQLFSEYPEHIRAFSKEQKATEAKNSSGSKWEASYLMRHLETTVEQVIERRNIRIFVDALDECRSQSDDEDDTKHIYELVESFQQMDERFRLVGRLSVCFACRHYPKVANLDTDNYLEIELCNREDIEEYVAQRLKRVIREREHESLRNNLKSVILRSANGNFSWVTSVIIKAAHMYRNGRPEILEVVKDIPKEMDDIYQEAIRKIHQQEGRAISLKFLQWICFAKRPLSIQELRFAIRITPNLSYRSFTELPNSSWGGTLHEMEKLVSSLSWGLAKVRGEPPTVFFIHQSVKDYLLNSGFSILDQRQSNTQEALKVGHNLLLDSCLWWLTESSLTSALERWMGSFSRLAVEAVITIPDDFDDFSEHLITLKSSLVAGARAGSTRHQVDAMDTEKRHLMRQFVNPRGVQDWNRMYPPKHRRVGHWEGSKEWLVVDEILACFLELAAILQSTPSLWGVFYCGNHWLGHALDCLKGGSVDAVKDKFRSFFSRGHPSLFLFLDLKFGPLQQAAGLPTPTVLRALLEEDVKKRFSLNSNHGPSQSTPLMIASEEGNIHNVEIILGQKDVQVDAKDSLGRTALFRAVSKRCLPVIELLIRFHACLDLQDYNGLTVLMFAAQNDQAGDAGVLGALLDHGASMEIRDINGWDAIDHATEKNRQELNRLSIKKYIPLHAQSRRFSERELIEACKNGNIGYVRAFFDHGIKSGFLDSQRLPSHSVYNLAADATIAADQQTVIELLLDTGGEIARYPHWRPDLLFDTVRKHARECLTTLISKYGWKVDKLDGNGNTLLHVAIQESQFPSHQCERIENCSKLFVDIIDTIISKDESYEGTVLNSPNHQSQSPLVLALEYEGTDPLIHHILADRRVNVNYQGASGTALYHSVKKRRYAVTELLLSHPGINPNLGSRDGTTPLQAASVRNDTESVRLLLANAATNITAQEGDMPRYLQEASREGFLQTAVQEVSRSVGRVADRFSFKGIYSGREIKTQEFKEREGRVSEETRPRSTIIHEQEPQPTDRSINSRSLILRKANNDGVDLQNPDAGLATSSESSWTAVSPTATGSEVSWNTWQETFSKAGAKLWFR